ARKGGGPALQDAALRAIPDPHRLGPGRGRAARMSTIVSFPSSRRHTSGTPANANSEIAGSVSMGTFLVDSERPDDPAVAVVRGVRYGAMSVVEVTGVPASVRDDLRRHAAAGSAAAQATLEWLDRQLLSAID